MGIGRSASRDGESGQPWQGYNPTKKGRHWAIPGYVYDLVEDDISELGVIEKLNYLLTHGLIELPSKRGGQPQIKRWEDIGHGNPLQDLWAYQPYTQKVYAGSEEAIDQDVSWAVSPLEATGYPTQKPEGLLARVIEASSRDGDIVLDCFAGSGTTCAVAEKLERRWIGIDCGKLAIYTIQKRLLNLRRQIGNKGERVDPKPFTLYNAGLYDFSTLRELPWESWRFFALQLFQCRDEPHIIGGIRLDGYLKGSSVLVFNHLKQKGVRIDQETIRSLHEALGTKVGSKLFIVAPALTFDFQQDYTDMDDVRYYALRIPYSIIHELHRREFTALRQPSDELAVNDTVEAVGFDFIRTPQLEFSCGVRGTGKEAEGIIKVKTFRSDAVVRDSMRRSGNRETLSMVMLDYAFDTGSQVFDLDDVVYADNLAKQKWEVRFSLARAGGKLMIVLIDIYGNEARVVIDRERFGAKATPPTSKRAVNTRTRVASHGTRLKGTA